MDLYRTSLKTPVFVSCYVRRCSSDGLLEYGVNGRDFSPPGSASSTYTCLPLSLYLPHPMHDGRTLDNMNDPDARVREAKRRTFVSRTKWLPSATK